MTIWSKNERISGKRINGAVGKAKAVNSATVPLQGGKTIGKVDCYSPYMKLSTKMEPLFWTGGEGEVSVKNLDDVVGLRDEVEVDVHDGRLWMTQGKHQCWFYVLPSKETYNEYEAPQNIRAEFKVDPSRIAKLAKKAKYVRIEAGINKAGERTVLIVYYDDGMNFIDGIDLKTAWEGEPVTAGFYAKDVSKWDGLGDCAKAKIYFENGEEDFPGIELDGSDDGNIRYNYVLPHNAMIINADKGYRNGGYYTEKERDWALSRNRKRSKAKGRRCRSCRHPTKSPTAPRYTARFRPSPRRTF